MKRYLLILVLVLAGLTIVACGGDEMTDHGDHGDHGEADHGDHGDGHGHGGHGEESGRIPNDGRIVTIISPEDGATYAAGEEVEIRVEFENFEMKDGSHWHYYIDDDTGGKMMMDSLDDRIRDLAPGEHTIQVFIAGGDHVEFADGDKVMITVTE